MSEVETVQTESKPAEVDGEDLTPEQKMQRKYPGLTKPKNNPLIDRLHKGSKGRSKFDSADHFMGKASEGEKK